MKLIKRHQFGGILNSLKQFLNPKYSIDEVPTGPTPPVKGWSKLPILEPDEPVDTKTYNGGTLPGVTVSAINLSKPQPFPYGGINVVSKSINGGLDKKQRVYVNPFDKSYLASNYKEGGLIRKHQFGGSNKSNRFISSGINNIPEINVNGIDRRWRLSKRGQNHGNGHGVTSEYFYDYYDGGNYYLGDNAVIKGGRTIYTSPKGNDTLYWNNPSEWLWYKSGLMPVGTNQSGAKQNFFKNLKRPLVKEQQGGTLEYQEGGQFKENLNPPTEGIFGEIKRNLRNGWQQSKRIASSLPLNILLGGIGAGTTSINLANKGKQFANWLVKDENPGLDQISALGWIGSGPAMGVAMFDPFGWAPNKKNEKEIKKYGASSRYDRERKAEEYRSVEPLRR